MMSGIRTVLLSLGMALAGAATCAAMSGFLGGWPPVKGRTSAPPPRQPENAYDRDDREWLAYYRSLDREHAEYQLRRLLGEEVSDPKNAELVVREALLHEAMITIHRDHADIHRSRAERAYERAIVLWEMLNKEGDLAFVSRRVQTLGVRLADAKELRGKKEEAMTLRAKYAPTTASAETRRK